MGHHKFPGVVGCIAGSHTPISKPLSGNWRAYDNRKKFNSAILQRTCREDMRFIDVKCWVSWANVFSKLSLSNQGMALTINGTYHVLGDAACPIRSWLLTTYRNHGNMSPSKSCMAHCSKRQLIEKAFVLLARVIQIKFGDWHCGPGWDKQGDYKCMCTTSQYLHPPNDLAVFDDQEDVKEEQEPHDAKQCELKRLPMKDLDFWLLFM